jgi:hypothetical protein
MEKDNLSLGNRQKHPETFLDLGNEICRLFDELCGVPQTVVLDGKERNVRVEVK